MMIAIEGIDRIGKSTCCDHLVKMHGYSRVHFGRPQGENDRERSIYQMGTFDNLFTMASAIEDQKVKVVLDRSHLGELVYGPMYRPESGNDLSYIHELEGRNPTSMTLILLTHNNMESIRMRDDGLSFDSARVMEEDLKFRSAFISSRLRNKHVLNVTNLKIPEMLDALERMLGLPEKIESKNSYSISTRFRTLIPL